MAKTALEWTVSDIKNMTIYDIHWIGLRENLQETMVFSIKYRAFL
jgi:hypothetical protein